MGTSPWNFSHGYTYCYTSPSYISHGFTVLPGTYLTMTLLTVIHLTPPFRACGVQEGVLIQHQHFAKCQIRLKTGKWQRRLNTFSQLFQRAFREYCNSTAFNTQCK